MDTSSSRARRAVFAVAPVVLAAGLGGLASRRAPQVYGRLDKPDWAPPASAFGPVWSVLYAANAAVGWRISTRGSARTRALHLTQLALNATWPATFFGIRDKRASLVVIAALDAALALEIVGAVREDPVSAALLAPYQAWTGFATALDAAVSDPGRS
ncbi:TspO/MBR family protein [Cellulomonas sp. HZM]|uniref:TspO/MBR family protein n=1 Tax=Cellulomonas sp. HZM TaxID=1454010 RepID=UPI000493A61A|nr:TspO/MBR family protein [Cellulomonas sp. HZM]